MFERFIKGELTLQELNAAIDACPENKSP